MPLRTSRVRMRIVTTRAYSQRRRLANTLDSGGYLVGPERNPEYALWRREQLLSRLSPTGDRERDKRNDDVVSELQHR